MPPTAIRPFHVLDVDDGPDLRNLLAQYSREREHQVTSLADGPQAVAELERHPTKYQLVITDLQLPGIDGLGVLRAARSANPSAMVIIVTGYASLDSAVQAVRLGAYDYLTKPFSLGQLDVIVQPLAERQAVEAETRQLARRVGDRESTELKGAVADRLQMIDARLSRIEELLARLLGERPRF